MSPDNLTEAAEAIYATGHLLLEQDRLRDAADVFRAMLLLFPSDERAWLALGVAHERMGQDAVAIELFSMGILAVPGAVRTRIALANALRNAGRDSDADAVFDAAEENAEASDDSELVKLVGRARRAA